MRSARGDIACVTPSPLDVRSVPGQTVAIQLDEDDDLGGLGFWLGKAVRAATADTCLFKVGDSFTDAYGTWFKRGDLVMTVQVYERASLANPRAFKLTPRSAKQSMQVIDLDSIVMTSTPIELVKGATKNICMLDTVIGDC